ncbi:MAG: phage holin family protein [Candidatus Aquicultor sp.]
MKETTQGGKTIIDAVLELFDLVMTYARQQITMIVEQNITRPIGTAARKAAFFILAFTFFSIASIFVAVGFFLLLASLIGYILAYLSIGAVLILGGIVLVRLSMRDGKLPGKAPKKTPKK